MGHSYCMKMSKKEIQHLFWRAGFGIQPSELQSYENTPREQLVEQLFASSKSIVPLKVDLSALKTNRQQLSKLEKRAMRKLSRQKLKEMNLQWLKQMSETQGVLREKMTFFFHDHFAARLNNPHASLHLNEVLRKHALGNFGTLLMEVSKSPAMILFLNNKQNKKSHPNENFAREVMELFTLGRDNGYTEKDIQEAGRAFTGWTIDNEGKFIFRSHVHDDGEKTILGETGNFKGEEVIEILLKQKQTARYLSRKLVDFFISRPIAEESHAHFATLFYEHNYNLEILIKAILLSPEFNAEASIGCRVKSPTELLVGISRQFRIAYQNPRVLIQLQVKLNQVLFYPPDVSGWASGKGWIDSSTLMLRMKLPSLLLNFGVIDWNDTTDSPEESNLRVLAQRERKQKMMERRLKAYPNWEFFNREIELEKYRLIDFLIQPELSEGANVTLENAVETELKERVIEALSLPEYQLC